MISFQLWYPYPLCIPKAFNYTIIEITSNCPSNLNLTAALFKSDILEGSKRKREGKSLISMIHRVKIKMMLQWGRNTCGYEIKHSPININFTNKKMYLPFILIYIYQPVDLIIHLYDPNIIWFGISNLVTIVLKTTTINLYYLIRFKINSLFSLTRFG